MEILEVGQIFPGWKFAFEGALLSITTSGGLQLLVSLPNLTSKEIEDFKTLISYGILTTVSFPHGLIIWELGNGWLVETPFNIELERNQRNQGVESFLKNDYNALTRILIDEKGIVRGLSFAGLQWDFIGHLKSIWQNKETDWNRYDENLDIVIKESTNILYRKAKVYNHSRS